MIPTQKMKNGWIPFRTCINQLRTCCRNRKSKKWPLRNVGTKWITDEMTMFQRIITKDATPKQVSNT